MRQGSAPGALSCCYCCYCYLWGELHCTPLQPQSSPHCPPLLQSTGHRPAAFPLARFPDYSAASPKDAAAPGRWPEAPSRGRGMLRGNKMLPTMCPPQIGSHVAAFWGPLWPQTPASPLLPPTLGGHGHSCRLFNAPCG